MTPKTDCPIVNNWFSSKETYLAWTAAWKKAYAALSEEIRGFKRERSGSDPVARSNAQWRLTLQLKPKAKALLELRKQSKEEAQRQYLAAKAQVAA